MSQHIRFDMTQIRLASLELRESFLQAHDCLPLALHNTASGTEQLGSLCQAIHNRRLSSLAVFTGAHMIKLGLSPFLVDLILRNDITHLATTGAGLIHDFELALVGETSEDVARWIKV